MNSIYKTIFAAFFVLIPFFIYSQKVDDHRAELIARNWGEQKMQKSTVKGINKKKLVFDGDTVLHVFNFMDGGFVIVPSDDNSYPVLGYSSHGRIDFDKMEPHLELWLGYYVELINENKSYNRPIKTKNKWDEVESGLSLKSVQASIPSLFESTNSSRWAAWNPYFSHAPETQSSMYNKGTNGCVPLAMSQIMKYFRYPLIGKGSNSYNYRIQINGQTSWETVSENFNHFFDFDLMPFQLTYCGNPDQYGNCNDGSFDVIASQDEINEVGKLQYLAGVSVSMWWMSTSDTHIWTGTYSSPTDWASKMAENFYFSSNYSHWDSGAITNNKSGFKNELKNSLNNGNPAIVKYQKTTGGLHAIVIDGYENDEFFHFVEGGGGYGDAYFYLFPEDADSNYYPRPNANSLYAFDAVLNIHPDCPPNQDVTYSNITLLSGDGELFQSGNNLNLNNITISNGDRSVLRADNEILITSNFEVELGGEILIVSKPCSNQ